MELIIDVDGTARFIYSDDLAALTKDLGGAVIRRASHVEPTTDGRWTADMAPVGGPVLGPYTTRAEALGREVEWLRAAEIPVPSDL